jgi:hypothetical protein
MNRDFVRSTEPASHRLVPLVECPLARRVTRQELSSAMPQAPTPFSLRRVLGVAVAFLYLLACSAVDLLPRRGAPDFRYTGSDPAFPVWKFGWPLAEFIYDSRSGLHVGPTAIPLAFLQVFIPAFFVALIIAWHWFRRRRRVNRGFPVVA